MFQTHNEYENLFQDNDMLDSSDPDIKYISAPLHNNYSDELNVQDNRVLAKYRKGDWKVEAQVRIDNEWYIARRRMLSDVPKDEVEFAGHPKRPVKFNLGMFTNKSKIGRIISAPLYGLMFAYYCVKGADVNLQVLEKEN